MAFESLTERLQGVFKNLRRKGKLSEKEVQEVTKEIRLALLEADVALPVVKTFIKRVRERAVGHEIIDTLDASQQIIKIVNEELTEILGSETSEIEKSPKIPTIIMMVGLQGAGKTTFAGKLANKLIKEQEARPMMIAADIYRPAAIDQLKTLGQQINVPVFDMGTETPAVEIVKNGLEQARANKNDYVLIDTAGRLQIDETLMQELHDIKDFAHPNEILLVVDSMIGQEAANVAKEFNEQLDITGVVLTKIDGDTRGGAALSIREITGKPIKFTGTGEKIIANGSGNTFIEVNKFIKDFNQAKQMMQGVMSGDMEQMMRQMGLNPNNLPKNMPNMPDMGNMDMSALEGMMGGAGMPDLGNMDLSQMLGGGLKGKVGSFAMKHAMKRQANNMKKAKKKRK